jgi:1-acyl-sn-glycerol-3-phosphate acyltransferase
MAKTNNKKKKEPWIKKRHKVITSLAKVVLKPYVTHKYGIKIDKFEEQGDRQYLILANHQTGFDQFFVSYAFKGAIYYIASEDIFSMGFISDLLRFAVNPIPIKKQTTDISAVLNCLRVAREGGTIAVFPEGNRTYSGHSEYINPAIIMLAKKMSLPIAIFKIEGGYGVAPRWGDASRKGRMHAYVSRVIEPEEYKALTDDEMTALINSELYINEARVDGKYTHKRLAEYLERAIYYCPKCGLSTFESHGDEIECKECGMKVKYLPTNELQGVNYKLPYRFIADWYDAQNAFVSKLDLLKLTSEPVYTEKGSINEVIVYKNKKKISEHVEISLFGDRIDISSEDVNLVFHFDDIRAITVCGKNKLNLYHGDKVYQITGGKRFNALKYVNFVFRYRNIKKAEKGEKHDEFLGL